MRSGAVLYLPPPDVRAGPVLYRGPGKGPGLVECDANGSRVQLPRQTLQTARLWVARGKDWRGPFRGWRAALDALAGLVEPGDLESLAAALQPGRGTERGAAAIAGGWRYRLAWGGDDPPLRFS